MLYLYLDESGDLGFDFVNKKPTDFFVVSILAINGQGANKELSNAAKITQRRKSTKTYKLRELKGSLTPYAIKEYLYGKIKDIDFSLYAVILNKKKSYQSLWQDKERIYSHIAYSVLEKIPLDGTKALINFIVDKSKSKENIRAFDKYILLQMKGKARPSVPLNIYHVDSNTNYCLQVADLFCWGIFRKYEKADMLWYALFKEKVRYENLLAL